MLGHPVVAQVWLPVVGPAHTGINRCYNLGGLTAGRTATLTWYHIDFSSDLWQHQEHKYEYHNTEDFSIFIHQGRTGWEEVHFETLFINDSFSILFLPKLQQREFYYSY